MFYWPESTEAAERANALLAERLGPADATVFAATGAIMRPSRLWPGLYYRLQRYERVRVIDRGRPVTELCVMQGREEPEADRLMAIMDWIEADERRVWEMANVSGTWPGMARWQVWCMLVRILGSTVRQRFFR